MPSLSPRYGKVVRDIWATKTRTILIVLSIAVGVFAFGSMFITGDVLVADMNAQYQAISPSTITFSLRSFDDDLVRWMERQPEVVAARGTAAYPVKLITPDQELNLDLYASDEFASAALNRITPESGLFPPGKDDLLFERQSAGVVGARVGDELTIETPDGRRHQLVFAGTLHNLNAIPASMFPQLSGYISTRGAAGLGLPKMMNRLDVSVTDDFDNKAKLEKIADTLKERMQDAGMTVGSIMVREPGEHWARSVTQGFSLIMTLIGFFSLGLSGFLVINTVTALLAEQRRQIGIMKAVGGTAGQIVGIYLSLVAVYGVLALVIALPVGMGLAYVFIQAVANFLNINILDFHLPARVLLLQIAAGLAVPVIASAVPVLGGVRVTAREAISANGVKTNGKTGGLAHLLLHVSHLPGPALLAIRNTFRRKGRLALTVGTLALAGTLFISVVNVRSSLMLELDNILKALFNYEVQLALDGNHERLATEAKAERVPGVLEAEGRTSIGVQYVKADDSRGATFAILGIPPGSDFVDPTMLSGRWIEANDRRAIVVGSKVAGEMGNPQPGDEVPLSYGDKVESWTIVGIMDMALDRAAYADFDYLSEFGGHPGLANSLLVQKASDSGLSQKELASAIEAALKKGGVGVSQTMTKDVIVASNSGQFDFLISFLLSMAGMTALIGALGLAGMMSLNVMERTREIGIMRSIGASHSSIGGIVASEGLFIGVISWALAIPMSIPFSLLFNSLLGKLILEKPLIFVFSTPTVGIWLGVMLVISAIASLLPAYRATRMSIRETLAYE